MMITLQSLPPGLRSETERQLPWVVATSNIDGVCPPFPPFAPIPSGDTLTKKLNVDLMRGTIKHAEPFRTVVPMSGAQLTSMFNDAMTKDPVVRRTVLRAQHFRDIVYNGIPSDPNVRLPRHWYSGDPFPARTSAWDRMMRASVVCSRAPDSMRAKFDGTEHATLDEVARFMSQNRPKLSIVEEETLLAWGDALGWHPSGALERARDVYLQKKTEEMLEKIKPLLHPATVGLSAEDARKYAMSCDAARKHLCMVGVPDDDTEDKLMRVFRAFRDTQRQLEEQMGAENVRRQRPEVKLIFKKPVEMKLDGVELKIPACRISYDAKDDAILATLTMIDISAPEKAFWYVAVKITENCALMTPDDTPADQIVAFLSALASGRFGACAERLRALTKCCVFCGKELTAKSSVERAAGDTCFKHYGASIDAILAPPEGGIVTGATLADAAVRVDARASLKTLVERGELKSDIIEGLREALDSDDEAPLWDAVAQMFTLPSADVARLAVADAGRIAASAGKWIPWPAERLLHAAVATEHVGGGPELARWLVEWIKTEPIPAYDEDDETLESRIKRMRGGARTTSGPAAKRGRVA
jgi:hypothetical protein